MQECLYYYRKNPLSVTQCKKAFDWDGPKLLAEHLSQQLDLSAFDLREQYYRKIVHELFLVVVSQFHTTKKYRVIWT